MSVINHAARELSAKIVYYGPGLSGKTTSLKRVYESVKPTHRGEMVSLATEGDRTLFFDFLPVKVERVGDLTLRLALYTVPGQVFYNSTRKLVLQGADGVVFVADSQEPAMDSNLESMENLKDNLADMGVEPAKFPLVIQYNKRDIPGVMPLEALRARLNPNAVPDFETVAARGQGVLESLRVITREVIRSLKAKGVVLKAPRPKVSLPAMDKPDTSALESQLEQAAQNEPAPLVAQASVPAAPANRVAPAAAQAPAPASSDSMDPGILSALVPDLVAREAALAEAEYRAGKFKTSVRHAVTGLRVLLQDFGEQRSDVEQATLAGLYGPDFARLLKLEKSPAPTRADAAFALLMLGLASLRLK